MDRKIIITIGRQFGSGGREIGKKLSEAFEIPYYDKELLTEASKESGICEEVFEKADELASNSLSYAMSMGFSYMGNFAPYSDVLSNDGLFKIQSDAIRKIAAKGSCVLVGRCADYILRDDPTMISVFIHNSKEVRIKRIVAALPVTSDQAEELMEKRDKSRASYYNYYTNKTWGASKSYDLSIDASVLGIDETVAFIKMFIEKHLQSLPPHFG